MSIVTKILKNFQFILVHVFSIFLGSKKNYENNTPALLNIKKIFKCNQFIKSLPS